MDSKPKIELANTTKADIERIMQDKINLEVAPLEALYEISAKLDRIIELLEKR